MEGDGDFAEMDPEELQGENEGNDDDVALNPEDILEVYEVEDGEIVGGGDEMADGENEDGDDGEDDGEWEDVDGEIVDRGDNSAVQFTGHEQGKTVFSVDVFGRTAVTGGEDDCAQVWRITDGQVLFKCTGHSDSVTRVQFNHDGQYVATASMDGVINVWNVSDGQLAVHLDCGDDLEWIDWHPRANFLIAGTASGSVYMWDVPAANMSFFSGHSASVMCGKWSIDGRTFITGSEDGNAIIWSPKNQTAIMKLDSKSNHMFNLDGITCIACHPDSIIAAFGGAEGAVKIVQTKTGKVVATLEGHSGGVEDLAFSNSTPSMLASSSLDGTVRIYDSTSTLLISTCKHDGSVVRLRWHPKEAILITASLDGTARVWDARTGDCIKICSGHNNHVLDVAISNDGQTVVSCGEDSRALVFTDAATRS